MALQKQKDTQFGIKVNYWKVVKTNIDWLNKKSNIIMAGYENEAFRKSDKSPLVQISFGYEEVLGTNNEISIVFPFIPTDNIVAKSYELIKQAPDFVGSLDV